MENSTSPGSLLEEPFDGGVKTVFEVDDREIFKVGTVFHYLDTMVNREIEGKVYSGKERVDRVLALKPARFGRRSTSKERKF